MSLRQTIAAYLDDIETPVGRAVNWGITGLVLLSSAIFVAQTYALPDELRSRLDVIDKGILVIFAIEYLLRLWSAEQRVKYFFSLFALLDLIVVLPFFLGVLNISFVRVFRWFRILRLVRFVEGRTIFGYVSSEDGAIFKRILFTLFSIIFVYSGLIYQVEHPHNAKSFGTFLDAVYFSVSTITTAGLGDLTPISQLGRLLTVLMVLTGVVLIPWQLGDLVRRLVKTANLLEITCSSCGWAEHDTDARFCKKCGSKLEKAFELTGKVSGAE